MVQSFILSIIKHHVSSNFFPLFIPLYVHPPTISDKQLKQIGESNGIHTFSGHKLTKSHQVLHVFLGIFQGSPWIPWPSRRSARGNAALRGRRGSDWWPPEAMHRTWWVWALHLRRGDKPPSMFYHHQCFGLMWFI